MYGQFCLEEAGKTALVLVDSKCAVGSEVNKAGRVNDIPEPRLRLTGMFRTFAL